MINSWLILVILAAWQLLSSKRQKKVVGSIKARHNMTNIVFDQLTPNQAKTRTYVFLTWQKPGDATPSAQEAGTYQDLIVKQSDGRWLFKERVLVHE